MYFFIISENIQIIIYLTLGSTEKKVPRRHQSLSGGSTLGAVYIKLLWDQTSIFPKWSSWRVKFSKNSNSTNCISNSRKKRLKKKFNKTTWYYLMVGSRKFIIMISITGWGSVLLNYFVWFTISVKDKKIFLNKFKIFMKKSRFFGKHC